MDIPLTPSSYSKGFRQQCRIGYWTVAMPNPRTPAPGMLSVLCHIRQGDYPPGLQSCQLQATISSTGHMPTGTWALADVGSSPAFHAMSHVPKPKATWHIAPAAWFTELLNVRATCQTFHAATTSNGSALAFPLAARSRRPWHPTTEALQTSNHSAPVIACHMGRVSAGAM